MAIIMNPSKITPIGRKGEEINREAIFKYQDIDFNGIEEISYSNSITEGYTLIVEQDGVPVYLQGLSESDKGLVWNLKTEDSNIVYSPLAIEGIGRCQIVHKEAETSLFQKSNIFYFSVTEALDGSNSYQPPNLDSWLKKIADNEALEKAETIYTNLSSLEDLDNKAAAIEKAYPYAGKVEEAGPHAQNILDAADDIDIVSSAVENAQIVNAAEEKIKLLDENTDLAEAWAVGTKANGTIDLEDSTEDGIPGKNNNAKYYAGEASNSASDASSYAGRAASSASQAAEDAYDASLYMNQAQKAANSVTDYNNKYNEVVNKYNEVVNKYNIIVDLESDIDKDVAFITKNIDTATNAASEAKNSAAAALASQQAAATSESNSATIKEEIIQLKTDTESIKETVVSAKNAAEVAQTAAETAQGKAESAQSAAEIAQRAAEEAAEKAEEAALGNTTEVLKGMINIHNEAEDAHETRFSTIEEQLKEAGTADTLIASTPAEGELSLKIWKGTKEEYKEIITKDPNTLYIVIPKQKSLI